MKPFHILLIPYWVEEILEQQSTSTAILTNFEELKKYLSQEDLVELLVFQKLDLVHATNQQLNGAASGGVGLSQVWLETAGASSSEVLTITREADSRSQRPETLHALVQRLDNFDAATAPEGVCDAYHVVDLRGENIGLVIRPGYNRVSAKEFYNTLQGILKVLYMYESTVKVVTRPSFVSMSN